MTVMTVRIAINFPRRVSYGECSF